jgi:serine/threonine protein kinase
MLIAQQLGRYHLLDRIAVGGMAEIYRAQTFDSRGEAHMVAIKRVLAHLADDDDFLQMLVDEAKIATLLDHPNIARVYEFVRIGEEYFIAMEYVDGRDLRSLLDRAAELETQLPADACSYIMMRVLEALHAAHTRTDATGQSLDIIHRDISPSNVIISYQGHVKLCDFGIAKARLSRVQTRAGVIKGKVKYMSPEQAMGRQLDCRSDVFSCGSVLYELLTAQPAFSAENEMALIFKVRDAKTTRPGRINPNVPSLLEKTLRRAMSRARSARYQSALEFADALREHLAASAPDFSPSQLGRFMRSMFAKEIEIDRRRLAEFVIQQGDPSRTGHNLLAEVLGEGAQYTRFTAMPINTEEREARDESARTKLMPRVPAPEDRLPPSVDLHDLKTEIIDLEEREKRIIKRKRRPKPGANHARDSQRATQIQTGFVQNPHNRPDPSAIEGLHDAETQILERTILEREREQDQDQEE